MGTNKWARPQPPVTKSQDLPADLGTFLVAAGMKPGSVAYDLLMMSLVSYVTRRDATVWNAGFQVGKEEAKAGKVSD